MVKGVRVIVLNSDSGYATQLRSDLLGMKGVTIVAEMDHPEYVDRVVSGFSAEVMAINLDPDPEGLLKVVKDVAGRYPELSVFGISAREDSQLILASIRAGIKEFLVRPLNPKQLSEAFSRTIKRSKGGMKRGRILSVVGSTGGSGSTTLATNLACELTGLSRHGVVLVDLDFLDGHVATLLGIAPQYNITDLCGANEEIDRSMVDKALVKHPSGLYVLNSPCRFIQSHQDALERSAVVINMLTENFEYVVCDGITRNDVVNHTLLDMTDTIVLVFQTVLHSLQNTDRFLEKLEKEGYNLDRVELVINRYTKENSSLHVEDAEERLGREISILVPSDWKTVSKASDLGQPVVLNSPKSKVRESLYRLALKIHDPKTFQKTEGPAGRKTAKAGFWSRVLEN
jgi:pilus assembly protein CpaE